MYLTIISMFCVCYDHNIRGNDKFITNFRLSLAQVNWNFVAGFSMCSRGPAAADSLQWFATADNIELIKWPNAQTIPFTVILSWISNHVHVKVWIKITDPFLNLTGLAAQWSAETDK